ncbi:MAG: hypothetical protein K5871_09655 [Lachnospiraceae bacterium]|nr:hypothetical protein [Lachnospiraceae bacterium]
MASNKMNKLIELLGDGHARTIGMLAGELETTEADVLRQIDYLEHVGIIRKVIGDNAANVSCTSGCGGECGGPCPGSCNGCPSGGGNMCHSCLPDGGFKNMGQMWELVKQ